MDCVSDGGLGSDVFLQGGELFGSEIRNSGVPSLNPNRKVGRDSKPQLQLDAERGPTVGSSWLTEVKAVKIQDEPDHDVQTLRF